MVNISQTATPADYWTPLPKTNDQRSLIRRHVNQAVRDAGSEIGIGINLRELKEFYVPTRSEVSTQPLSYTLDGYSYRRASNERVITAIITRLGLSSTPEQVRRTDKCTSFMNEGIEIKLYHFGDAKDTARGHISVDINLQSILFGYDGLYDLINIVLKSSGFKIGSESLYLEYEENIPGRGPVSFNVAHSADLVFKALGMSGRAFSDMLYSRYRDAGEITSWLLTGKYISFNNFFLDENKRYVGPGDYFGCDLFRQAVAYLQVSDWNTLHNPKVLPETARKHMLKNWEGWNRATYKDYNVAIEGASKYKLINEKYNDSIIQEVTGWTPEDVMFKTFKPAFEQEIYAKQDLEFFLLSSSVETIKARIAESHQRLTA
jgi:hypothetical protein